MENWKEEFVKKFWIYNLPAGSPAGAEKEALSFIESLLTQQEARLKQELRERIEEQKGHEVRCVRIGHPCTYSDAIDDVLDLYLQD